jgi:HSP20 family protein
METKTAPAKNGESAMKPVEPKKESAIERREELPLFFNSSPFTFMRRFADDMERMFEDWGFGPGRFNQLFKNEPEFMEMEKFAFAPQIETLHKDDRFIVRTDLPGVKKDDVNVEIRDNMLMIRGERKHKKEEKHEGYFHSERAYGSFFRRIPLPEGANTDKTEATFRDGVLEISLKVPEKPANGKKIEIL